MVLEKRSINFRTVKLNRKKQRRHKLAISEIKEVSATDSWTSGHNEIL